LPASSTLAVMVQAPIVRFGAPRVGATWRVAATTVGSTGPVGTSRSGMNHGKSAVSRAVTPLMRAAITVPDVNNAFRDD
jgi:hypothetical protein